MKREEIYRIWANAASPWSNWVAPVLFTVLDPNKPPRTVIREVELPWAGYLQRDTAVILNLPACEAVQVAVSLAWNGYSPIPVFNATPPSRFFRAKTWSAAIDVDEIIDTIHAATPILASLALPANSVPVFLLDSNRLLGQFRNAMGDEIFDNRWVAFPEDFPSAEFFIAHGIKRVLIVQSEGLPLQGDLAQILLKWQDAGLEILATTKFSVAKPEKMPLHPPSTSKVLLYRMMVNLGLRRAALGGLEWLISDGRAAS
jgi:hypothetical protein